MSDASEAGHGRALHVTDLSVHFGGLRALDALTFGVPDGSLTGVIGPNGAGKSTLFDVISGLRRPTSGRVAVGDRDVTGRPADAVMRCGVSRTFQNVRLAGHLGVLENVLLGLHGRGWRGRAAARSAAAEALRLVKLDPDDHRHPPELSYGERKRVEMARAVVNQPAVLLLDEPFAGLNAAETRTLVELTRRVHARGTTVLLVEHDMSAVMALAERIVVLNFGTKLAEGTPSEVRADPTVVEAYLGTDSDHAVAS